MKPAGAEAWREAGAEAWPGSLRLRHHQPSHLLVLHDFGGRVERGSSVVVAHMGEAGVQQLAQPKVCEVGRRGRREGYS